MKRTIKHVIIHCAATPNGKPFRAVNIDGMHQVRGFKRSTQAARNFNPLLKHIGYHFVIGLDGVIESGRSLEEVGAHVQGNNSNSIGICMIGTDQFTTEQWNALRLCLVNLAGTIKGETLKTSLYVEKAFADMGISVKGHRDYSPDLNGDGQVTRNEWIKICPGFDVATWLKGGMVPLKGHVYA
jgi:N-acetylmuramoyl-L-alanine amidase